MSAMEEGPLARFERVRRPVAREEGLLVENLADETVIYDSRTKEAHCLSPLAALAFAHCDGDTTIEQLAALATDQLGEPVDESRVIEALVELQERDLLAVPPGDGFSRRDMIRRTAVAGAAVAASAPLITSIVAPTAAMAASGIATGCSGCGKNPDCVSNHCCQSNAGKQCSQGCCVGANNSCHFCNCVGSTCQCTVTPAEAGIDQCPCICGTPGCVNVPCCPTVNELCCTTAPAC